MTTLQEKKAGRKYNIAVASMIAATGLMVVPALLTWAGVTSVGALMTGGEYVSLMLGLFGLYVGGNVVQKKVLGDAGVTKEGEEAQE